LALVYFQGRLLLQKAQVVQEKLCIPKKYKFLSCFLLLPKLPYLML